MKMPSRQLNVPFVVAVVLICLNLAFDSYPVAAEFPVLTRGTSEDPAERNRKFAAIDQMIRVITMDEDARFEVLLRRYYIEGKEYFASALSVSQSGTPNISRTMTGFECNAFFPPHMVHVEAREGKEIVNGVVQVKMRVKAEDIRRIFGIAGGSQFRVY